MDTGTAESLYNQNTWPDEEPVAVKTPFSLFIEKFHREALTFAEYPVEGIIYLGIIIITSKSISPLYWNPESAPVSELQTYTTTVYDGDGTCLALLTSNDATNIIHFEALTSLTELEKLHDNMNMKAER